MVGDNFPAMGGKWKDSKIVSERDWVFLLCWAAIFFVMWVIFVFAFASIANAEEYTDEEIITAIYHAEGGEKTKYPYGIRSIPCESKTACRKVCEKTIQNNRVRFARYGHKQYQDFISFLSSRYCPIGSRDDPQGLNKNWLKNVKFFLAKNRREK
jgi:hypothetical protein